jgi:exopolysaccharide production protein ExoZ
VQDPDKKFATLQILRALAAWTVVFHHYMQFFFDLKSDGPIGGFFAQYGSLGVVVFFVLSGFVMYLVASKSTCTPKKFLIERLFRIAPLYWFYTALIVLCIYLFPRGFYYTDFNIGSLAASAFFIPSWNPGGMGQVPVLTVGWTLNFEMFFYVSLALCMAMSPRHSFKILFAIFLVLPFVYPKGWFLAGIAHSFKLYEFLAGVVLSAIWAGNAGLAIRKYQRTALAVALCCAVLAAGLLAAGGLALPIATSIVALALLCEHDVRPDSRLVRALVRLGDMSYSTYLVHCIVIGISLHFWGRNPGTFAQLCTLAWIIASVYLTSAISHRWIERNPFIDAGRLSVIGRIHPAPPLKPSML